MISIQDAYNRYLRYFLAKDDETATVYDKSMALAYAVRSAMVDRWIETQKYYHEHNLRRVYYLSMENTLGRLLHQNIVNTGLETELTRVAQDLGFSLDELFEKEDDFELGYGGRGRLAACLQESMATLGIPAQGYGLRYDFSAFRQRIQKGRQIEAPHDFLHKGHPWEIIRPEYACTVKLKGASEPRGKRAKKKTTPHEWHEEESVVAIPSDVPILGYRSKTVNNLRLWSARSAEEFPPDYVNHGDYVRACEDLSQSGRITRILYPEEDVLRATGRRIRQQYFFVSASLQDIVRRYKVHNEDITALADRVVIQLNGSRCALAVPELMRILVDEEGVDWDTAWEVTRKVFAYTSHAVARDDQETCPVYLLTQMLPRHVDIIYELNQRHLDEVRSTRGNDVDFIRDVSMIEEGDVKRINMARMGIVGSSRVNGVSKAQAELLKTTLFPQLHTLTPGKFLNVTNGVSHRRWLLCDNSLLARLITEAIGDSWIRDAEELRKLEDFASDTGFLERLNGVKQIAKQRLLISMERDIGLAYDPTAMFAVQCKRIHPYKRQVLHLLGVVWRYLRIREGELPSQKRLHIFAGVASPSDHLAKQIIRLVHAVAELIERDSKAREWLRIMFVPGYGITWAEKIMPAAELAEEIATPNMEACGTTNFKMALNAAVPIISRAGANLELIEEIGEDNMFVFGQTGNEIQTSPDYNPSALLEKSKELTAIFALLENEIVSVERDETVLPLLSSLRYDDRYRVLVDLAPYVEQQYQADARYGDRLGWARCTLMNIAHSARFSSDRAVAEYSRNIWNVESVPL